MAKYIKQEMSARLHADGVKAYYRMKTERNIGFEEFVERMCSHCSGVSRGDAVRVLLTASDTMAELLAEGYSVSLEDIGTFKATIGLQPDKEMDAIGGDGPHHNALSLRVDGVRFHADKELIWKTNRRCTLERGGESCLRRSPYTKEERLQRALAYLDENGGMKVRDYMKLTGLSHTVAASELRDFRRDQSSGIDFIGRGSAIVYVKKRAL